MIIAIDTGGTKTLVASFSDEGILLKSFEFPTPKSTIDYISSIQSVIIHELQPDKIEAISIAAPGIIENQTIKWAKNLDWRNFDIKAEFEKIFPKTLIFLENDANLAGLFEAQNLSAKNTLYLTFSTGVGGGFITNKHINRGLSQSEVGRVPVHFHNQTIEWEEIASARKIVELYGKFVSEISANETEKWQEIAERISLGILTIIPIFQPDFIVFGGSLGGQFENYHQILEKIIREKVDPEIKIPRLILAQKPKEAVIYGCYKFAKNQLG